MGLHYSRRSWNLEGNGKPRMIELQEADSLQNVKKIYPLLGEQVDHYWNEISAGLKECPGYYDLYTPEWTYIAVKTGRLQVWALSDGAIRGIVVTQICAFPRKRVFEIMAIYGIEMLQFFSEMQDVFMWFAEKNGCEEISAICRPGLQRLLKGFGAESRQIVLRRAVISQGAQ